MSYLIDQLAQLKLFQIERIFKLAKINWQVQQRRISHRFVATLGPETGAGRKVLVHTAVDTRAEVKLYVEPDGHTGTGKNKYGSPSVYLFFFFTVKEAV